MPVVVEERFLPMLVTVFEGTLSDADLSTLFERHRAVLEARRPFVHLGDTRTLRAVPTATQRARIARWQAEIEPLSGQYNVGSALVTPNTLVRGTLTAINWIQRPVTPQYYAPTIEDAYTWCIEQLARVGLADAEPVAAFRATL